MVSIELEKAQEWLDGESSAYSNKAFTERIIDSFDSEGIQAFEKNLKNLKTHISDIYNIESYINAAFDFRRTIHKLKRECYKENDYIKSVVFYVESNPVINEQNKCKAIERRIYYKVRN